MNALWWWIDRWRKSTAYTDMTLEEQGAYRNLLDEANLRGGALPNDERILAKACGDALAWSRVRAAVLARFELRDDGYHNATLDEVIKESARRAAKQARYRKARGNAGGNGGGNDNGNPGGSPSPDPSPSPYPSQDLLDAATALQKTPPRQPTADEERQEFAHEVWTAFCQKGGYPETRQASSNDGYVMQGWISEKVPLQVVLRAIKETRGSGYTLAYYRDPVRQAHETWRTNLQVAE